MSGYVVKTLPRGAKPDRYTTVADLTKEVFVTNSQKMACAAVDGSARPMAVLSIEGGVVYDNFAKSLGFLTKQENAWVKAGQEADRQAQPRRTQQAPKQRRQQPERREKKAGPTKGRFDHVKPIRAEQPKREVIVERV